MSQPTGAKPWKRANTDWFMRCRWGLFAHYLADTASNLKPIDLTVDDWNRRVDAFDVDGLARQLAAAHVPYFIITLGKTPVSTFPPTAPTTRSPASSRASVRGAT